MGKISSAAFVEFLQWCVANKCGYIMGSTGQDPKKWSTSSWWFTQYSGQQKNKALYWRAHAPRVFDCQGLAEGYINDCLGTSINVRARDNYASWCPTKGKGIIPAAYRQPGAAVFVYSSSSGAITHVGYLEKPVVAGKPSGDWYVIEARGVMYGVVRTKLLSRSWNRWGLMGKYFDYGEGQAPALEHGLKINADSVNLRFGPGTQYAVGRVAKKGEVFAPVATEDWLPLVADGRACWVAKKYATEV